MKKIFSILVLVALLFATDTAFAGVKSKKRKADKQTVAWNYEVVTVGKNASGSYLLKVWSYSASTFVAEEQAKKNAIHAMVFQGAPENKDKRIAHLKPLLQDPTAEVTHAAFFEKFFSDSGEYRRFARMSNNGFADVIKYGKKDMKYKVGVVVLVETASLRKYLEQAGIIRTLNQGFN
jgi:hypothetical protein